MNDKYTEIYQPQYIEVRDNSYILHGANPQPTVTPRFYENDVECIPCRRNEDGIEGFYNPETKTFRSVRQIFQDGFTINGDTYIQHD